MSDSAAFRSSRPSSMRTGTRPPAWSSRTRRGSSWPSRKTTAPAARCSGQSVSISIRTAPARPLAPTTRATASRSLVADDLQLDMAAVPSAHHPQEAADRVRDPSVSTDDPAHVVLVNGKHERDLVVVLLDVDADGIRVLDEGLRDVVEEILHDAGSVSESASTSGVTAASAVAGSAAAFGSGATSTSAAAAAAAAFASAAAAAAAAFAG